MSEDDSKDSMSVNRLNRGCFLLDAESNVSGYPSPNRDNLGLKACGNISKCFNLSI